MECSNLSLRFKGIIVAAEQPVDENLQRVAQHHGLPILHSPIVESIEYIIRRLMPAVVLVPVAERATAAVDVIRKIAGVSQDIFLVTIVSTERLELEQRLRQAGAHCYLCGSETELLEQVLYDVWRRVEQTRDVQSHEV